MSEQYWEERYQTCDTPWEKGECSPGLADWLTAHPEAPRGSVLVPGCGTGHDAREWAKHGFEVHGLDIAPSARCLALEKTGEAGLNAHFHQGDFLHGAPFQTFDWVFEHTLFCAINPDQREAYVQAVRRWLKPGGNYLAVNYLIPDKEGPPFGTTKEEVLQRFQPHFELFEDWVPRSYPNRTGLEHMFWWRLRA